MSAWQQNREHDRHTLGDEVAVALDYENNGRTRNEQAQYVAGRANTARFFAESDRIHHTDYLAGTDD